MASAYYKTLGARLRAIRIQQGLSLQGLEEKSHGRWKAVVVGSYERGDRGLTVQKLAELAEFYGVPVIELIQGDAAPAPLVTAPKLVIDLQRMRELPADTAGPLARYAAAIQGERHDYNGQVLSVRHEDLRALAVIYGKPPADLIEDFISWGIASPAARGTLVALAAVRTGAAPGRLAALSSTGRRRAAPADAPGPVSARAATEIRGGRGLGPAAAPDPAAQHRALSQVSRRPASTRFLRASFCSRKLASAALRALPRKGTRMPRKVSLRTSRVPSPAGASATRCSPLKMSLPTMPGIPPTDRHSTPGSAAKTRGWMVTGRRPGSYTFRVSRLPAATSPVPSRMRGFHSG